MYRKYLCADDAQAEQRRYIAQRQAKQRKKKLVDLKLVITDI